MDDAFSCIYFLQSYYTDDQGNYTEDGEYYNDQEGYDESAYSQDYSQQEGYENDGMFD